MVDPSAIKRKLEQMRATERETFFVAPFDPSKALAAHAADMAYGRVISHLEQVIRADSTLEDDQDGDR